MLVEEKPQKSILETDSPQSCTKRENNILSVIIRCHKTERLSFFDEALFSLAIQYWHDLEVVVVLQNGTKEFEYEVNKLIKSQPFHKNCKFQVHVVKIAPGVDGRSSLLNHGIRNATGRYLAFLDDDDVVYHHGYKILIQQLIDGKASIAVGGCRTAKIKKEFGNWHTQVKETPFTWGRTRFDLLRDNFIPIHSYVIDRDRTNDSDLYFDDDFPLLEDYDFLLRLNSKYEFDFSKLDTFVCEYRHHDSNSLPMYSAGHSAEVHEKYARAFQLITERKKDISLSLPISDLLNLLTPKTDSAAVASVETTDTTRTVKSIEIEPPQNNGQNPQIIRQVFDSSRDKVYNFFSHYPRIEKSLSKTVHFGYRVVTKLAPRNLSTNQN
jgi:glycosyltransferase involved in cell wall biosynthesis